MQIDVTHAITPALNGIVEIPLTNDERAENEHQFDLFSPHRLDGAINESIRSHFQEMMFIVPQRQTLLPGRSIKRSVWAHQLINSPAPVPNRSMIDYSGPSNVGLSGHDDCQHETEITFQGDAMRGSRKIDKWVVYKTLNGPNLGRTSVCTEIEWESIQLTCPGVNQMVRQGIVDESAAEKFARGTSGDTKPRRTAPRPTFR